MCFSMPSKKKRGKKKRETIKHCHDKTNFKGSFSLQSSSNIMEKLGLGHPFIVVQWATQKHEAHPHNLGLALFSGSLMGLVIRCVSLKVLPAL